MSESQQQTPIAETLPAVRTEAPELPVVMGFGTKSGFELIQRAAKLFSSSSLVPKDFQGNMPNCVIALNMANRIGADPLMIMQNLVIVHGRPTWASQFMIACVNTCGRFDPLRFEFFGTKGTDTWGCRAIATDRRTRQQLTGPDVTINIAKKEGWYAKNGSKWQSIPQLMLMYRAGSWWARAYAPELTMGLHTQDEVIDMGEAEIIHSEGAADNPTEALNLALGLNESKKAPGSRSTAKPTNHTTPDDKVPQTASNGEIGAIKCALCDAEITGTPYQVIVGDTTHLVCNEECGYEFAEKAGRA